ncbi:MAG TPA: OsmC family protein [Longimicrobiales bacterium]|nr:OsmC family protein [Longimicrobiales bacterium]
MSPGPFRADLAQRDHFRFDVTFGDEPWAPIVVDEPAPLGDGAGPNAARLLAAAVGNCLAASLLLCLEKSRVELLDLRATVEGVMERNERGRFRIPSLSVTLEPTVEGEPSARYDRCLDLFEDFCIVTQSIRKGIEVDVSVAPTFVSPGDLELAGRPV